MKIQDIMSKDSLVCHQNANLAEAARRLWDGDCGMLPVVDGGDRVVGVITDRDICMALLHQGRPGSEVMVNDVMQTNVQRCAPEDTVDKAMKIMADKQIHRIPVTDKTGKLKGILSSNDLILAAKPTVARGGSGPTHDDVLKTLQAISRHRLVATRA